VSSSVLWDDHLCTLKGKPSLRSKVLSLRVWY
jgi:hypothetical protein